MPDWLDLTIWSIILTLIVAGGMWASTVGVTKLLRKLDAWDQDERIAKSVREDNLVFAKLMQEAV